LSRRHVKAQEHTHFGVQEYKTQTREKEKLEFRHTHIGVQVYKVTDQVFPRNKALQPRIKKKTLVQENPKQI
jgi:hypothetical protein